MLLQRQTNMSVQEIKNNLETKEGLMLLISQIIKDEPNDQKLGQVIRSNFQYYLDKEE